MADTVESSSTRYLTSSYTKESRVDENSATTSMSPVTVLEGASHPTNS